MKKNKYEISLWEDVLVQATDDIPEHYEEEKIAVIGSHSMTAQFKAREPKLVENTNGTSILTFKIFYNYIDNETGEKKENPFLKLLVNERKVKAFWKNKWYNLIIKGIQEDSGNKSITITCKDQFIHELSKTGFGLTFSNELMNNSGSLSELGERTLKGTDWFLDTENTDIIRQTIEEPVYVLEGIQVKEFVAQSINGEITIPAKAKILVYYSIYQNKSTYFQFHYAEDGNYLSETNSTLIINGESCWVESVSWSGQDVKDVNGITILTFAEEPKVSNYYRAKRYVKQQLQEFDNLTKTYCNVYEDDSTPPKKVYGYIGTRTDDATIVVNLLANNGSTGFTGNEGWSQAQNKKETPGWLPQSFGLYPELTENNADKYLDGTIRSFLCFEYKAANALNGEVRYLNTGVSNNTQYLEEGFSAGETYIFRYKAAKHDSTTGKVKLDTENKPVMYTSSSRAAAPIVPRFGKYNKDTLGIQPITEGGFDYYFTSTFVKRDDEWIEFKLTCQHSISKKDIYTTYFDFIFGVKETCWLQEAQLFKETFGEDENGEKVRLEPSTINGMMIAQPEYRYYYFDETRGLTELKKEEDIGWVYIGLVDIGNFDSSNDEEYPTGVPKLTPIYPENDFEKIRSIEAKNSNRFNILQTLAETFECYPVFNIKNDFETGKIIYENGLPKKSVSFKESIGEETGLTFVYGIDLKTISRTINSEQIVTKTIVLDNNNQYAKNGFCTIKRASENQSKANYILNFDYYISHGLVDGEKLNMDLYDTSLGSLGLYHNLGALNSEYDRISELKGLKQTELDKLEAQIEVYEGYLEAADEEIVKIITNIKTLTQLETVTLKQTKKWLKSNDMQEVKDYVYSWVNINNNSIQYSDILDALKRAAEIIKNEIEDYDKKLNEDDVENPGLLQQIEALEEKFYKKYSRFIQEGSWNSEEYIDDNLYYLDAKSVSYTSSRPQVQYNISVLRLSALEEFKGKIFKLGDIAAIQDTEFFGYVPDSNPKTPYKEKVLISEITSNFESPENDSLKIQNYKTQFEDLFQRITATTQSLQYASGEYQKAASVVESDGTIKPAILQNSIALNEGLMINYQNNAITQDSTGITLTDKSNPNRKVKITSGGIIFTNNGSTWKTGIDAEGIRSDYLTAGSINADKISIYSGAYPTFRWSSTGLDAYAFGEAGVQFNRFVRFDQYGIYGIGGIDGELENIWKPTSESDIWDTAQFGMTWRGFFVKNKEGNGWVELSSENDIAVFKNDLEIPKIKIGRIGQTEDKQPIYGIRIADDKGKAVLVTDDIGLLWLRDKLRIETYNSNEVQIGKLDEKEYTPVEIEDFEENEVYYVLNESSGEYVIATSYEENTQYYSLNIQEHGGRVIDANGHFIVYEDGSIVATDGIFSGQLNAASGSFRGELLAASGSFSGNINAQGGNIGNVEIGSNGNLKVVNSGLSIVKQEYLPLENLESLDERRDYYILNEVTGKYELAIDFQEGVQYYELVESSMLYYNEEEKVLELTGDAIFSGNIGALTGTFTGELQAQSGRIGGFIIKNNKLDSEAGDLINPQEEVDITEFDENKEYYTYQDGYYIRAYSFNEKEKYYTGESFSSFIQLIGSQGHVIANSISLGTSASIAEYIKLGKAYIYNPEVSNKKFISVLDDEANPIVSLTDQGMFKIGKIEIDGNNSQMVIGEELIFNGEKSIITGKNWSITPEIASFNQIAVTNGIFKTGEIQSLGGSMLFKPVTNCIISYDGVNNKIIEIDGQVIDGNNSWVLSNNSWVILSRFNQKSIDPLRVFISDNEYFIDSIEDLSSYDTMTYYCTADLESSIRDNLIIGVNSGSNSVTIGGENFLSPKAISFTEIYYDSNISRPLLQSSPSLVIGELESVGYEGYGLYGENVFLNGTLTTKVGEDSYAGVNTITGVQASKFREYEVLSKNNSYDESRIVFWGGADSRKTEDIQNANFQVTENGSIFANQGIFEGTLITKSTIEGSILKATKIYGWSISEDEDTGKLNRQSAALSIYNTAESLGISFREELTIENEVVDYLTLDLNTKGFTIWSKVKQSNNVTFLSFSGIESENPYVDAKLNYIDFQILNNGNLNIEETKIGHYYNDGTDNKNYNYGAYLDFGKDPDNLMGIMGIGSQEVLSYASSKVTNKQDFESQKNIIFGTESGNMRYEQQLDEKNNFMGYDLYIS